TPEAVREALKEHPKTKAIMLVYPTYQGICGDIAAIAAIAHQHSIPLLVDEAHGPHFSFHPDLPTSALAAGADLTVQSSHKVIGAMTQASMLHVQGSRIDRQKLTKSLQLLQSTSPSYLLLASLDAARGQIATQGKELLEQTLKLSSRAINSLSQLGKLTILKKPTKPIPGFLDLDLTRLTVGISQLGLNGFAADEILHQQLGVTAELPMLQNLTFIISLGNTKADIEKLVQGFATLTAKYGDRAPNIPLPTLPQPLFISNNQISPREAFFAPSATLPIEQTVDRISAEIICPYPPGIPILMPGEKISASALNFLQKILAAGGSITGCSDTSLKTIRVVH
ncbi:MAG: DegT/DnrJ/EryC1/StrS family aminotransferase, partial [Spirulinaceae cyanobacterium]